MQATAYPLQWPENFTRSRSREKGAFRTSLTVALGNVRTSLRYFAKDSDKIVADVVISSNVALGHDHPEDPGIAVWFRWDDLSVCIPVDRYTTPEANLQAIHHVIEARRVELRHGTLALVRATLRGFAALPAPSMQRQWHEVLNVERDADVEQIEASYRTLAKKRHPDSSTGSVEKMSELNVARDRALKERK